MTSKFDKITTIVLLSLMTVAVGVLIYFVFFRDKSDTQEHADRMDRQLDLKEREIEALEELNSQVRKGKDGITRLPIVQTNEKVNPDGKTEPTTSATYVQETTE